MLQFRQTGSIWCLVNLKIRHERLLSIPRRETDKGAQRKMQRYREIPETVPSIWMTSLPDHLGPNEHIAMPLIIYHNVDIFFYLSVCCGSTFIFVNTNGQG